MAMPMMAMPMMPMMNPMMGLMAGMASMANMAKAAKAQAVSAPFKCSPALVTLVLLSAQKIACRSVLYKRSCEGQEEASRAGGKEGGGEGSRACRGSFQS